MEQTHLSESEENDDAVGASEIAEDPDVEVNDNNIKSDSNKDIKNDPVVEVPDAPDMVVAEDESQPSGVEMPRLNIPEAIEGAEVANDGSTENKASSKDGNLVSTEGPQPGDVVEPAKRPDNPSKQDKKEQHEYTNIHPEIEDAARQIQRIYRSKICVRRLLELVRGQFEMVFDPDTGDYFYFNKKTGESQWTKPKTLKDKQPYRDDAFAQAAARKIQNLFRTKIAMKKLREMIKGIYKKEYDPSTGDYYYVNTVNGMTMWDKPAPHLLADDEDLELDEDSALLIARDEEISRLRQQLAERDADIQRVRNARLHELEEEERSKRMVDVSTNKCSCDMYIYILLDF